MATTKQILANQKNAKKSCGPRSPRGKKVSSMNALKTGLFSKQLLLPDDDDDEFNRLRADLHEEWRPVGRSEKNLVERLVALFWRQRRIYRAESGLFAMFRQCPERLGGVASALAKDGRETEAFTRVLRMDGANERSIALTLRMVRTLQEERGDRKGLVDQSESPSSK
jgi:hypothetical protein